MSLVIDVASWFCLLLGAGFSVVGAIGLLRLPDFYTRVHAVGVIDTMGAGLILLGCALQSGLSLIGAKLLMIWALIYLTGPAATHALAKAAYASGLKVLGSSKE